MNNNWKRITTFSAALLLAATTAAGCSSPDTSSSSETEKKITATLYDRGSVPPEAGTIDNNRWTQWINENSPVEVDFVPFPRFEQIQKLNLLFASGDAPDLILEYDNVFLNQLYTQKQLMPLDELIEEHSTNYKQMMEEYPQLATLGQMDDGNTYLFGRVLGMKTNDYILIRKDWLDKLNLNAPATTEELLATAKAFREQDPDGNGVKDTFGMNIGGVGASIVNSMFNNSSRFVNDGELVNPKIGEQAKAAADFQKRLFDEGIIDKDFLTDKNGDKAKQDWVSGKLGIYLASSGVDNALLLEAYKSLLKNNPDAVIDVLPLPEGPYGSFNPAYKSPIQMTGAINTNAKDPESVMKYIDFLVEENTIMTLKNGIEGEHYTKDADGVATPIDPEKNKAELVGMLDLNIMSFLGTLPEKEQLEVKLDLTKPDEKAFSEIIESANAAYLNPDNKYAYPIMNWPGLPADLQIMLKNTETTEEIWKKSIVSGRDYTTEQALSDVQSLWESAGGSQIDQFYEEWFQNNQDSVIYIQDFK